MKPIHCILLERDCVQRQDNGNKFEMSSEYAEVNWLSFCGTQVFRFGISINRLSYTKILGMRVVSRIKVQETRGRVVPRDE